MHTLSAGKSSPTLGWMRWLASASSWITCVAHGARSGGQERWHDATGYATAAEGGGRELEDTTRAASDRLPHALELPQPSHLVHARVALLPVGAADHAQQGGRDAAADVGAGQQVLGVQLSRAALLLVGLLGGSSDRAAAGCRCLLALAAHGAGGHHLRDGEQQTPSSRALAPLPWGPPCLASLNPDKSKPTCPPTQLLAALPTCAFGFCLKCSSSAMSCAGFSPSRKSTSEGPSCAWHLPSTSMARLRTAEDARRARDSGRVAGTRSKTPGWQLCTRRAKQGCYADP